MPTVGRGLKAAQRHMEEMEQYLRAEISNLQEEIRANLRVTPSSKH